MGTGKSSLHVETIDTVISDAVNRGLIQLTTQDQRLDGRRFRAFDGELARDLLFFGSCSYLGLELHPAVIAGAQEAAGNCGSQFSSSRAFVSVGLYDQLEALFRQIFRGHSVIVSPTTTLGHLSAIPVLARPDDAIILDQQVHASVQTAAQLAKSQGTQLTVVPHNHLEQLERRLVALRGKHQRIWFMLDGVYSMYGNVPRLEKLRELMQRYRQLHLYIDDAHGMSWAGERGCGLTLHQLGQLEERMVMATSLAKGFGCGGGVLVFGNPEWARLVRNCGGPMIFSGPIQPPILGAAIASARLHVDGTVHAYQDELQKKTLLADRLLRQLGLPLLSTPGVPILFVPAGLPRIVYEIIQRMMKDGFYLDAGVFPATPMKRGGIRLTLTRHLRDDDIVEMAQRLAFHHAKVLAENEISTQRLEKVFRLADRPQQTPVEIRHDNQHGEIMLAPELSPAMESVAVSSAALRFDSVRGKGAESLLKRSAETTTVTLKMRHERDIHNIDPQTWDAVLGHRGGFDWNGLRFQQSFFQDREQPLEENRWEYHYLLIEDGEGTVVLATFFTVALAKDDMFASSEVSEKVELQRRREPYAMTSKVVMLGSMMSEGCHLYLDTEHPGHHQALGMLTDLLTRVSEEAGAGSIVLRDFEAEDDQQLRETFLGHGFTPLQMPDNFIVDIDEGWPDLDTFLKTRLKANYRSLVRRHVLANSDRYRIESDDGAPVSPELIRYIYELYLNVREGKVELNTFPLPFELFEAMNRESSWELTRLYLGPDGPFLPSGEPAPIAVTASYRGPTCYEVLLVGLNYDYLHEHDCYKQAVFQSVQRANALGMKRANLGFTSGVAKRMASAKRVRSFAYVQLEEHYPQEVLKAM